LIRHVHDQPESDIYDMGHDTGIDPTDLIRPTLIRPRSDRQLGRVVCRMRLDNSRLGGAAAADGSVEDP